MKTRETFGSGGGSSTRKLQGGAYLFAVATLLSLGVLAGGCGSVGPGGWYGSQCSSAVAGADAQGGDFSGCVLNNADLSETDFSFADFEGAELNNASFWIGTYGAVLEETKFNNVLADSVDFTDAYLFKADFRPQPLVGGYTDLQWSVFAGAVLTEARMNEVDLRGADLSAANLDCANLQGADLRDVDFTDASLVNADLTGAQLTGATFDSAIMTGANLNGTDWALPGVLLLPLSVGQSGALAITTATCVP